MIAKGATVRLKVPAPQGEVTARRFNDDADQMEFEVTYPDAENEGQVHVVWFLESKLEVVGGDAA